MQQPEHFFPSYTRLEHLADACVHVAGIVFSIAATVFLLVAALRTLPAVRYRWPDRLLHRAHRHVWRIRRL